MLVVVSAFGGAAVGFAAGLPFGAPAVGAGVGTALGVFAAFALGSRRVGE